MNVYLKKDDRQPALKVTITDGDGAAVNLTGCTAAFRMRARDGSTLKVNAAAVITDAAAGKLEYRWAAADTDTVGYYLCEFVITYGDATKQTVPSSGHIEAAITKGLP